MNIKLKALAILAVLLAIPAMIGLTLNYASTVYGSEVVFRGILFSVGVGALYVCYSMIVSVLESREQYNRSLENLSKNIDKLNSK